MLQERQVQPLARLLVQEHVEHSEQECRVGLRLDRDPLGRARAGDRKMRLDLYPLHATFARIGMALDAANPARHFDVGAKRNQIVAEWRVGRNRKSAMPKFAVEMLGVVALDALAAAEAHVNGAPGSQECWQCSHVGSRRAPTAEACSEARVP